MSMAMKYGMMKRGKKAGAACDAHGDMGCMACGGEMMAEGGEVKKKVEIVPHPPEVIDVDPDIIHHMNRRLKEEKDRLKKPKRMAEGGMVDDDDGDDMVGRILRGHSEPVADFEENDFDYLDEHPQDHEADYTGEDSGDEVGDKVEDDDEKDIVSRAMKSWKKKDRMPRPA